MKYCSMCGEHKEYSEFTKNISQKDGFNFWCRECKNKNQRARRQTVSGKAYMKKADSKTYYSDKAKAYRKTDEWKEKRRKLDLAYRDKYPKKVAAHEWVRRAVKRGALSHSVWKALHHKSRPCQAYLNV